jgi:hypothetical protein
MYAEKIKLKQQIILWIRKKNCFSYRGKNNSKLSKKQTDTQNLYHLLHQSWSYNETENGSQNQQSLNEKLRTKLDA